MSRVQLALNVADLDAAVDFYSQALRRRAGQAPSRLRQLRHRRAAAEAGADREPGRTAGEGVAGALNHLGVEVETPEEVQAATVRLAGRGPRARGAGVDHLLLRRAGQGWVDDPDGAPWEVYTVLADAPAETGLGCSTEACAPEPVTVDRRRGSGRSCC